MDNPGSIAATTSPTDDVGLQSAPRRRWRRWVALFVATVVMMLLMRAEHRRGSLAKYAEQEAVLRQAFADDPVTVYIGAFALYSLATGMAVPGAMVVLAVLYGWFFGFWPAFLIVSFGSALGATSTFLFTRCFLRGFIQRWFGRRLLRFNTALEREGAFYLFTMRLIPQIPYSLLNIVMGLSPMPVWTFWWVTQLGMLAGLAVLVSAGASVGSLEEFDKRGIGSLVQSQMGPALTVFGVSALAVKWVARRRKTRRDHSLLSEVPASASQPG